MRRILTVLIVLWATPTFAQCLPIPNGDTRALVLGIFNGRPFNQQTLTDAEPFLNSYGIQLTPPNASGERTKIGDPLSGHWTRVGFGEGHPVWIPQSDSYTPIPCVPVTPTPVPPPPPVVVPPSPIPPPVTIDVSAILAKLDDIEKQNAANTARLEAAINEPGWFKTFFSNRYVQMALGAVAGWLGTKAAQ